MYLCLCTSASDSFAAFAATSVSSEQYTNIVSVALQDQLQVDNEPLKPNDAPNVVKSTVEHVTKKHRHRQKTARSKSDGTEQNLSAKKTNKLRRKNKRRLRKQQASESKDEDLSPDTTPSSSSMSPSHSSSDDSSASSSSPAALKGISLPPSKSRSKKSLKKKSSPINSALSSSASGSSSESSSPSRTRRKELQRKRGQMQAEDSSGDDSSSSDSSSTESSFSGGEFSSQLGKRTKKLKQLTKKHKKTRRKAREKRKTKRNKSIHKKKKQRRKKRQKPPGLLKAAPTVTVQPETETYLNKVPLKKQLKKKPAKEKDTQKQQSTKQTSEKSPKEKPTNKPRKVQPKLQPETEDIKLDKSKDNNKPSIERKSLRLPPRPAEAKRLTRRHTVVGTLPKAPHPGTRTRKPRPLRRQAQSISFKRPPLSFDENRRVITDPNMLRLLDEDVENPSAGSYKDAKSLWQFVRSRVLNRQFLQTQEPDCPYSYVPFHMEVLARALMARRRRAKQLAAELQILRTKVAGMAHWNFDDHSESENQMFLEGKRLAVARLRDIKSKLSGLYKEIASRVENLGSTGANVCRKRQLVVDQKRLHQFYRKQTIRMRRWKGSTPVHEIKPMPKEIMVHQNVAIPSKPKSPESSRLVSEQVSTETKDEPAIDVAPVLPKEEVKVPEEIPEERVKIELLKPEDRRMIKELISLRSKRTATAAHLNKVQPRSSPPKPDVEPNQAVPKLSSSSLPPLPLPLPLPPPPPVPTPKLKQKPVISDKEVDRWHTPSPRGFNYSLELANIRNRIQSVSKSDTREESSRGSVTEEEEEGQEEVSSTRFTNYRTQIKNRRESLERRIAQQLQKDLRKKKAATAQQATFIEKAQVMAPNIKDFQAKVQSISSTENLPPVKDIFQKVIAPAKLMRFSSLSQFEGPYTGPPLSPTPRREIPQSPAPREPLHSPPHTPQSPIPNEPSRSPTPIESPVSSTPSIDSARIAISSPRGDYEPVRVPVKPATAVLVIPVVPMTVDTTTEPVGSPTSVRSTATSSSKALKSQKLDESDTRDQLQKMRILSPVSTTHLESESEPPTLTKTNYPRLPTKVQSKSIPANVFPRGILRKKKMAPLLPQTNKQPTPRLHELVLTPARVDRPESVSSQDSDEMLDYTDFALSVRDMCVLGLEQIGALRMRGRSFLLSTPVKEEIELIISRHYGRWTHLNPRARRPVPRLITQIAVYRSSLQSVSQEIILLRSLYQYGHLYQSLSEKSTRYTRDHKDLLDLFLRSMQNLVHSRKESSPNHTGLGVYSPQKAGTQDAQISGRSFGHSLENNPKSSDGILFGTRSEPYLSYQALFSEMYSGGFGDTSTDVLAPSTIKPVTSISIRGRNRKYRSSPTLKMKRQNSTPELTQRSITALSANPEISRVNKEIFESEAKDSIRLEDLIKQDSGQAVLHQPSYKTSCYRRPGVRRPDANVTTTEVTTHAGQAHSGKQARRRRQKKKNPLRSVSKPVSKSVSKPVSNPGSEPGPKRTPPKRKTESDSQINSQSNRNVLATVTREVQTRSKAVAESTVLPSTQVIQNVKYFVHVS